MCGISGRRSQLEKEGTQKEGKFCDKSKEGESAKRAILPARAWITDITPAIGKKGSEKKGLWHNFCSY
jgi:hypothetical protein